jgi:hypothetical protein
MTRSPIKNSSVVNTAFFIGEGPRAVAAVSDRRLRGGTPWRAHATVGDRRYSLDSFARSCAGGYIISPGGPLAAFVSELPTQDKCQGRNDIIN